MIKIRVGVFVLRGTVLNSNHAYIFIIGAAKCGTTALADMLGQHKNVCLSNPKESDFFTDRVFENGFEWYESRFNEKDCYYRVDASVSYTAGWGGSSKNIAERIKAFCPDAKIIYIMRDPIDRTWSSYWHAIRNGKNQGPFDEVVRNPESDHVTASQYINRIDDYLCYFDRKDLLLLSQRDLQSRSEEILRVVGDFVGISGLTESVSDTERKVNSSYRFNIFGEMLLKVVPLSFVKYCANLAFKYLPSWVSKSIKSVVSQPVPEISSSQAEYLAELYTGELDQLKQLYGLDLKTSRWWS